MTPINITYIANKDTTDFNNNNVIKKGTIVQGAFAGSMPNGEIRITTTKGEIIKQTDLQEQSNVNKAISIGQAPINVPQGVGQLKQTFLERHKNHLVMAGVPIGFYAFSKYQKYDSKKTLKVTIIGSVVVLGAIVLNALTGMWSGNTFMDSKFGKQKYW